MKMNLDRLYEILSETTIQLRKGEVVTEEDKPGVHVMTIDMMPHQNEAKPEIEKVDMEFLVIGVDKAKAESHKSELIELLNTYPNPEQLAGGPSYITVGAEIGDQGAAFQLFALGKVLKLWDVITPALLGVTGNKARDMAGSGFIMISGYRPQQAAA
jgi:hypothetical protein